MAVYAGIDWGGTAHAVCVLDESAVPLAQFEVKHEAAGLAELGMRLRKFVHTPSELRSPSSDPPACWSTPWWRPALRSSRSTRTSSRPAGRATGPPPASAIRATPTCWPTSCAPTAIASARSAPSPTRSGRCAPWCAAATTWSGIGSPWPTSCAPCWRASGPAPPLSSPTSTARSRWPSSSATRPRKAPLASARSACAASWPAHAYCGRRTPSPCSRGCAPPPMDRSASRSRGQGRTRPRPRAHARDPGRPARHPERRIEHAVAALPDGQIVMSFPRSGRICAAQILAELGDVRERFPTEPSSPPRPASPRHLPVRQVPRRRLPLGLQQAPARRLITWADNSRHACPGPPTSTRARDDAVPTPPRRPHPRPRLGARAVALLDRPTPYDPAKHHAAASLLATA